MVELQHFSQNIRLCARWTVAKGWKHVSQAYVLGPGHEKKKLSATRRALRLLGQNVWRNFELFWASSSKYVKIYTRIAQWPLHGAKAIMVGDSKRQLRESIGVVCSIRKPGTRRLTLTRSLGMSVFPPSKWHKMHRNERNEQKRKAVPSQKWTAEKPSCMKPCLSFSKLWTLRLVYYATPFWQKLSPKPGLPRC